MNYTIVVLKGNHKGFKPSEPVSSQELKKPKLPFQINFLTK